MRKIDLSKEKVLFRCFHADDLTAYKMIENKVHLTPTNAPTGDFELALITNPKSPYGFSAISKENKDKWEYMGVGHSGVCSIITALLKELQAKEQECEELNKLIEEAEEAPICFKCKEEPCIRQERDRYKKLSIDFKDVNKQLGYKIITLKQALDEIEEILDNGTADTQTNNAKWLHEWYLARFCEIRDIINKAKDGE